MFSSKVDEEIEKSNNAIDLSKLKIFTRPELAAYNGVHTPLIYVAVKGLVYDVTGNEKNYGPGKSYHRLVGKDVSRLLGLSKLKLPESEQGNTWSTKGFGEKENKTLDKWVEFYKKRYLIVGMVVGHEGGSGSV